MKVMMVVVIMIVGGGRDRGVHSRSDVDDNGGSDGDDA